MNTINYDTYLDLIGEEKYNDIKNDIKTGTDNAITYSKDIYETGKQKLKKWYEGWK